MKNSLEKYKIIFDNSISAILFTTPDGSIVEVNKTAEEMFGYTQQEFVCLERKDVVDYTDADIQKLIQERKEKGSIKAELIGIRKNGERFPIKFTSTLFVDDDGKEYSCTTMQDISIRKSSEQEMAVMIDNTGESFILLNANLNVVSFSKELQNLGKKYLGFEIKKGNSIFDYAQPERIADLKAIYTRVLKGAVEKSNITIPLADDANRYFTFTHSPTKDEKGTIIGVFVTARDVTDETESQLAIKETKAELEKIMDFSRDVICTIDVTGNFVKVSKASEKVWGYSPDELVGQSFTALVHPDDLEKSIKASLEVIAGIDQTNFQNRYIKKDGTIVPIIWSAKWDETEKMMFCVAKDGTEKVKKEEALVESEKLYKNLFENSPAPMFIFDFKTLQIIDCNEETLLKYGYTKEEFLSLTIKDIRPPEDIEQLERAVSDESIYGRIHKNIWRHKKKNGDIMFMDISGHLMTYKGRRVSLVILIDITDTLKLEEQKEFEKRDKEALINGTDDLIWSVSKDFKLIAANQAYITTIKELTGITIEAGDDILMPTVFSGELNDFWKTFYSRALAGESFKEEIKSPATKNSKETWSDISFNPIYKQGEIVGIACYGRNITESKKALSVLKDREAKLRAAQQIAKLGYWERNIETGELFWSSEVYKIWGINKNGKPDYELFEATIHPEDINAFLEEQSAVIAGDKEMDIEHRILLKDGTIKWVHVKGSSKKDNQGNTIFLEGTVQDITERKKTEEKLKESIERYENVTKATSDAIWDWDLVTNVTYRAEGFKTSFGFNLEELNAPETNWDNYIHPEDRTITQQSIKDIIHSNENFWKQEYRIIKPNGQQAFVQDSAYLVRDETNKVVRIIGALKDITERKNTDDKLKESIARYENVTKATSDAIWDWDIATNKVFWGEPFNHLFGKMDDVAVRDEEKVKKRLHPEEVEQVIQSAKEAIKSNDANWSYEHRYLKADGTYAYVTNKALIIRDKKGNAVRVIGAMQDITQRKQEELQLKLMSSVVTNTDDAVLITEAEPFNEPGPRIIYVNDAFTKMTGYTAEEIIGKTPRILQGPKSDKKELLRLRKALENWESCEITLVNYKKNGEEFWVNMTISPVADEKGWFTHWIAIERDVTIHKNEELQNELIADISIVFNESAKLHETLDKTLRLITNFGGFCFAEVWISGSQKNVLLKTSTHSTTANMKLFLEDTNAIEISRQGEGFVGIVAESKEIVILGDLANQKVLRRRATILKYGVKTLIGLPLLSNNEVIGVLAFGLDYEVLNQAKYITLFNSLSNYLSPEIKRKQLEQELNQLFNFAPDLIVIVGLDGYFKRINPVVSELLGYTDAELYAVPYTNFVHPEDRDKYIIELDSLIESNTTNYFEIRNITKSGKVKWLAWNAIYITEENNIYAVAKDITEKKELEELLQKANELARIGGWEVDIPNNTIFWSDITKEIHEVDPDYIPKLKSGVHFYKKGISRNKINKYIKQAFKTGKSWDDEFQIVTGKGNERWVRVIGEAELVDGKFNRIYGSFQDIDDRKKAEEQIKNSEERQKLIMNAALDAIICIDKKGIITFWNPEAEQIFGWNATEVVGRLLSDIIIPESHRALHENGMKNYLKTGKGPALNVLLQFKAIRRDGEHFPIELTVLPILQDGEEFFCAFIRDISERKAYESRLIELNESLKKQKAELIVSNQELEQFAYIASHDLQEPLRMVSSFITLLNKKYGSNFDETATSYIDFALDGAKRMRLLILDLLEYSRVGKMPETKESIDLNTLIEEIKILYRKQIEEQDASIIVFGTLPLIKSYKSPLLQLFQNLISNALKYSRKNIHPIIKISVITQDDNWLFAVEDNGIGIEEEYFDRIFVIFQRLHSREEYGGTGMGLAVTKKIVESLGGKIWLDSTLNEGSTFYFTIPKHLA
ncbi:PAS domain S-box protein [Flavobacterium sp. N1994]|uniref:PAS domain S-box protein n=1 Tax=Flavobacterium sp. N1994 TaxID=2986827 RepID=UPI002221472F|nr:PAS domain S-box protein [Flavobacterium sp. N1994]